MTTSVQTPATAEELKTLIVTGDSAAIAAFFAGMPERQRRTFVKPLREHLKTLSWRTMSDRQTWNELRERCRLEGRPLLLAGVATAASAGSVAKWIRDVRRITSVGLAPVGPLVGVLADRAPEWLPELPGVITETLDWSNGSAWGLAESIAALTGTTPTATNAYVLSWAGSYVTHGRSYKEFTQRLERDPHLDEFLPRLFEDDEGDFFLTPWSPFRRMVETLLETRIRRGPLLEAVLGRLLRGGRPGDLANILTMLDALAPTPEEYRDRISSCISLLSSAHGPVARRFLDVVKQLSDAGALDVELAVEGASIAVARSEKNMVRTALTWLDALVTRHPDRAGEIVPVIATAFGAQAPDLQERAAKLVAKRARLLTVQDGERLADGGRLLLPPDLAATLATALGVADVSADALAPLGFPEIAPYAPRPMPGPITTPEEAAEVLSALIWRGPDDPMLVERFLEAVVEFSRSDADGLREAFAPVVERSPVDEWQRRHLPLSPRSALHLLAEAAAGTDPARVPHRATAGTLWSRMHGQGRSQRWNTRVSHDGPLDVLVMRIMELVAVVGAERLPSLVAVPTSANGLIDPAVLAERLRRCQAEGREPLGVDFRQALLRLPHDCGTVDVSDLVSDAGREFAAWTGGERFQLPVVRRTPYKRDYAWGREPGLTLRSSALPPDMVGQKSLPKQVDTLFDVVRVVWDAPSPGGEGWSDCLPAMLPADPDVVAVALAPPLHLWSREDSPTVPAVLAEAEAPRLDALHFVLADRLVGADAPGRAGAVDAALVLASRGLLDGALLAADMVSLLTSTEKAGLRKAVPCLRDLANGGAAAQVWDVIAGVVADVLPPRSVKALTGAADLLALGTEIAGALGVTTPIEAVADLAARKGSGNVQAAARRLDAVLAGR